MLKTGAKISGLRTDFFKVVETRKHIYEFSKAVKEFASKCRMRSTAKGLDLVKGK